MWLLFRNNSLAKLMVPWNLQWMCSVTICRCPREILMRSELLERIYGCFPSMDLVASSLALLKKREEQLERKRNEIASNRRSRPGNHKRHGRNYKGVQVRKFYWKITPDFAFQFDTFFPIQTFLISPLSKSRSCCYDVQIMSRANRIAWVTRGFYKGIFADLIVYIMFH